MLIPGSSGGSGILISSGIGKFVPVNSNILIYNDRAGLYTINYE